MFILLRLTRKIKPLNFWGSSVMALLMCINLLLNSKKQTESNTADMPCNVRPR